jgi:hypothetical protein
VDPNFVITSVLNRWLAAGGANSAISNIAAELSIVSPNMAATFNTLNNSISNLVDPTYGMVAGVNCLLIGEDLITTKNTVCVSLFNSLYYLYLNLKNPDDLNIIRGPQVQTKKKTHRRALGCNPTPPLIGSNYPW